MSKECAKFFFNVCIIAIGLRDKRYIFLVHLNVDEQEHFVDSQYDDDKAVKSFFLSTIHVNLTKNNFEHTIMAWEIWSVCS